MANGLDMTLSSVLTADAGREVPFTGARARLPTARLDRARLIENGIFGFDNLDPRAQSFVFLRWQLLNGFYQSGGRTIAITSTRPGDGKSFITANLAAALSRVRPTILLDLDLRRPVIGWRFGLSVGAGIDDLLTGEASSGDALHLIEDCGLGIAPVRVPRPRSSELLSSDELPRFLAELRGRPDDPICIVDTPPALVVDDVLLLAPHLDGVLIVVEEGKTRADELRAALRLLKPVPIVGTVLNRSIFSGRGRDFDQSYYYR